MNTLWQDLRYGARLLATNPGFAAVAVLTLALGIGANSAIFSVINGVLLSPLPYPDPDRLVVVWDSHLERGELRWGVSHHDFEDWRERATVFEDIAIYNSRGGNLTGGERAEMIEHAIVTPGFLRALGIHPLLGRTFQEEEELPGNDDVAVISYGLWQRRFGGDREVLGKTIVLSDQSLEVVGVMPRGFEFPSDQVQVWKPIGMRPEQSGPRDSYWVRSIARLKPGITLEQAQAELDGIMAALAEEHPDTNRDVGGFVEPLHEWAVGWARPALLILWGTVGFVLLIACANVANLLLARGAARERELALRTALGAPRGRIIRQLLTESVLLSILGGGAGLLLAVGGVRLLLGLSAGALPRMGSVTVDGSVLAFVLGLSLLTGIVFGLLPAFRAARSEPGEALKEGNRAGSPRRRLRSTLVVAEVALAVVVLVGAGLLIRSFANVMRQDPGFLPENLLAFRVEPPQKVRLEAQTPGAFEAFIRSHAIERTNITRFYGNLLEQIEQLPGVRSAAATNNRPLSGNRWGALYSVQGRPSAGDQKGPIGFHRAITSGYLRTMGIPLLRGRAFKDSDTGASPYVALVNRSLARALWPNEDPLGQRITSGDPENPFVAWYTVVGIVGDVRHDRMDAPPGPIAYVPMAQARFGFFRDWGVDIVVRSVGDPLELVEAVRSRVHALDSDLPVFGIATMEGIISDTVARRRFNMVLLGTFAAVALLLAAVGLYGVISYSVSQRTREIGIRMALGADAISILRLVVGQGMGLVGVGVALGLGVAVGLTRFLQQMLFGVTPTDLPTFLGISLLLAAVALVACYVPTRRATAVDPTVALRYE